MSVVTSSRHATAAMPARATYDAGACTNVSLIMGTGETSNGMSPRYAERAVVVATTHAATSAVARTTVPARTCDPERSERSGRSEGGTRASTRVDVSVAWGWRDVLDGARDARATVTRLQRRDGEEAALNPLNANDTRVSYEAHL